MEHIKTKKLHNNTVKVYVKCNNVEYRLCFRDGVQFCAEKVLSDDAYRGRPNVNTRQVKGPKKVWDFAAKYVN